MSMADLDTTTAQSQCCGGATSWVGADEAAALAMRLGAIADPARLQIPSILANAPDAEVCACDFVAPIERAQPTISHHLEVLTGAGLVAGDKRGRWMWYRLCDGAVDAIADSLSDLAQGRI